MIPDKTSVTDKLTILLAEDDVDDQELLKEAFLKINPAIQFLTFNNGKKFLQTLENIDAAPHLIILDYNIPEMNGAEILQHINGDQRYNSMIKIVWSTSNSPLYRDSCLASGAHAYFVKPYTLSGLEEMARNMLSYLVK